MRKFYRGLFNPLNDSRPLGKEWKEFWRAREVDPETRRQVRQEKRDARKHIHRKSRRLAKEQLKDNF